MPKVSISSSILDRLLPNSKPYFIRDTTLRGFGVKVNPSGSIKYIAEVLHKGRTSRKTLGQYPVLALSVARKEAFAYIASVKSGSLTTKKNSKVLIDLLGEYTANGRLKERTVQDYREAIHFYLQDWLKKPVASISKQMVESRFYQIRDRGIAGGKPTYSQATKTMRILSALMNYAMADDLIQRIFCLYSYRRE